MSLSGRVDSVALGPRHTPERISFFHFYGISCGNADTIQQVVPYYYSRTNTTID
jgi:hypothetical protein